MKISIEESAGRAFSIKFPNWLVLNRLGIGFVAKNMVKQGEHGISIKVGEDSGKSDKILSKKELRCAAKKMKRALLGARSELRAFLKRHPGFVLVDVQEEDGEHVTITF